MVSSLACAWQLSQLEYSGVVKLAATLYCDWLSCLVSAREETKWLRLICRNQILSLFLDKNTKTFAKNRYVLGNFQSSSRPNWKNKHFVTTVTFIHTNVIRWETMHNFPLFSRSFQKVAPWQTVVQIKWWNNVHF